MFPCVCYPDATEEVLSETRDLRQETHSSLAAAIFTILQQTCLLLFNVSFTENMHGEMLVHARVSEVWENFLNTTPKLAQVLICIKLKCFCVWFLFRLLLQSYFMVH